MHHHFEALSSKYALQLPAYLREHLVNKKTSRILDRLRRSLPEARYGLEIGCGRGWELGKMVKTGLQICGSDVAPGQVKLASRDLGGAGVSFVVADGRHLPFHGGSFDFAYAIGSLHHVEDEAQQREALREMGRVIRPNGFLFLHETNPRNPLFRFYMGYVFPVLRDIDVGTEVWVEPASLRGIPGLELVETQYFSFMPDFLPARLYRLLLPAEAWLERTTLRRFSAHYMAVLRRVDPGPGP